MTSIYSEINRPFPKKLKRTENIVKMFTKITPNKCCVSCSFGKDSVVALWLVQKELPSVDVVFCNTLCQYPETYTFKNALVEQFNLNLVETKPSKVWWQIWDKFGIPDGSKQRNGSSLDRCCYHLKERPMKDAIKAHGWKVNFTGLTALESHQRMLRACQLGMMFYSNRYEIAKVHPLIFWTEKEVWEFIEENSIPLNPAYQKRNLNRLGCMICTAHKGWRKEIAENNPRLYRWIQERYFKQKLLN